METKTYLKGEMVFNDGTEGSEMYYIVDGKVHVFKMINAEKVHLAVIGKGEVIGEMSLFLNSPRSASVEAMEDTTVQVLDKTAFSAKIQSEPEFAMNLLTMLAKRLDYSHDVITRLQGVKKGYEITYGINNK
jgi:CRP-like cAMP-binding protein